MEEGLLPLLRLYQPVYRQHGCSGAVDNLLLMYCLGWEGVGLCSYLLIGFYYRSDRKEWRGGNESLRGDPCR